MSLVNLWQSIGFSLSESNLLGVTNIWCARSGNMTERAYRGRSYTLQVGANCDIGLRINTQKRSFREYPGRSPFPAWPFGLKIAVICPAAWWLDCFSGENENVFLAAVNEASSTRVTGVAAWSLLPIRARVHMQFPKRSILTVKSNIENS